MTRITLRQIEVWFSSDQSPSGGVEPGAVWLDTIRSKLSDSKAIVVLVSPRSVSRPWLLFETGFGASNPECEVIPICIELGVSDVPFPLAMYQCYQLSDYDSIKRFAIKFFDKFDINFDEEMARPVLQTAISEFTKYAADSTAQELSQEEPSLLEIRDTIVEHIDRRFMQMSERQVRRYLSGGKTDKETRPSSYSVPIHISFPDHKSTQYMEIDTQIKLSRVMDKIYFMISDYVEAGSYLEEWILTEKNWNVKLIVQEVQSLLRACDVFTPESEWEASPLGAPYRAGEKSVLPIGETVKIGDHVYLLPDRKYFGIYQGQKGDNVIINHSKSGNGKLYYITPDDREYMAMTTIA